MQRLSSVQLTAEAFDNQTGANLGSNLCSIPTPGTPNDGGSNFAVGAFNGDISYIRAFQATVALGTPPGNASCAGDLLDFEFEGNGNDCSGSGLNMTMAGDPTPLRPVLLPVARFNVWPTLSTTRAGAGSLQLAGSSFSSNDDASDILFLAAVGRPDNRRVFEPCGGEPDLHGAAGGDLYHPAFGMRFHRTMRDSDRRPAGAVSTDSNAVVVTGLSPAMDNLLGPLVIANATANPWPYGDLAEIGVGTNVATRHSLRRPNWGRNSRDGFVGAG